MTSLFIYDKRASELKATVSTRLFVQDRTGARVKRIAVSARYACKRIHGLDDERA